MEFAHTLLFLIAQQAPRQQPGGGGGGQMIFIMGGMFLIFYLLMIRPQQKRQKEHQAMLDSLKKGDEVVTSGGIVGRVHSISDQIVTIEVAEKVRIRVTRGNISALRAPASGKGQEKGAGKK